MFAKVDYAELKAFRGDLELLEKDMDKFFREAIKNIALRAIRKIKQRTPVDTGTLRNAWQVGEDIIKVGDSYQVVITNETDYAEHIEYGHRTRPKKEDKKEVSEAKNIKQAEPVENAKKSKKVKKKPMKGRARNGYVPGVYMMTISMREIEKEMDILLLRELEKYLKRAIK